MEEKWNRAKESLTENLNLPKDIVMDIPKVTIMGDSEVTIENHKGIVSFEDTKVKVNSRLGLIIVEGYKFKISFIGGTTLTITGKVKEIKYERV